MSEYAETDPRYRWLVEWALRAPAGANAGETETVLQTRIGDLAVRYGWITPEQWREVQREAQNSALDTLLVQRGWLHADQFRYASSILGTEPARLPQPHLGGYEILGRLGSGAMGVVYRAIDPVLRREVALKVLPDRLEGVPEVHARFAREAAAVARLAHPGVVQVHSFGEDGGIPFLVLELLPGPTLLDAWRTEPDLARRVGWIEEVARAIAHAHARGVLHRDLKPGNVMFGKEGAPKVMDFGLAWLEGDGSHLTAEGAILGTPAYMAPEQVDGRAATTATDVYALGVMLFQALTGELPFGGQEMRDLLASILLKEPPRPGRVVAGVPADLETVALRAMEKEPHRRYESAAAFAEDLRRWREGEPILARPSTWTTRLGKRVRRNPWAWGAGVCAGTLVLAVAAITLAWGRSEGVHERSARAREALQGAREAVEAWRMERYLPPHDLTSARRRLQAAGEALRRVVAEDPGAPAAWGELGWVLFESGNLDGAREALERAVAISPSRSTYRWRLGRVLVDLAERQTSRAVVLADPVARREENASGRSLLDDARAHFLAAAGGPGEGAITPAERLLANAYLAWRDGRIDDARALARELARTHARGGEEGRLLLGRIELELGQSAWSEFDLAADHARSWIEAYLAGARARLTLSAAKDVEIRASAGEAVEIAGRAIAIDPARADARVQRGAAWLTIAEQAPAGSPAAAEAAGAAAADLAAALDRDPGHAEAHFIRGRLRWLAARAPGLPPAEADERYREALADLERATTLEPGLLPAWRDRSRARRAWAESRQGRGIDATDQFRAAVRDDLDALLRARPLSASYRLERAFALSRWGLALLLRGEDPGPAYREALDDLAQVHGRTNRPGESWSLRAEIRLTWTRHREAAEGLDARAEYRSILDDDLARALRDDPDSVSAHARRAFTAICLARARERCGEDPLPLYASAVADATWVIERQPSHPNAWWYRGLARGHRGHYLAARGESAEADLRAAVEEDLPKAGAQPGLRLFLDQTLLIWGMVREAQGEDPQPLLRRIVEQDLSARRLDADGWRTLAHAHLRLASRAQRGGESGAGQTDLERAIEASARAIALRPGDARAWQFRGLARAMRGARGEAITDLEQALTLDPRLRAEIEPELARLGVQGGR